MGVGVGAVSEQQLHGIDVSDSSRHHQRRVARPPSGVWVRAGFEEHLDHGGIAVRAGQRRGVFHNRWLG